MPSNFSAELAPVNHPFFPAPNCERQDTLFGVAFEILREGILDRAFPGASVAVIHQRKLVAAKGLGRFTYEQASPEVSPTTIFDVASLTKVVATTSMGMMLYQQGLLDLEVPVVELMPEFGGVDARRRQVTVRMILAHSSGLPAHEKLFLGGIGKKQIISMALAAVLTTEPGICTKYSDIGFIILGAILERIADEPLDQFCQREIFGKLGMSRTSFNPPASSRDSIPPTADDRLYRKRIIQGEVQDENASAMGGVAGHAGVFSSVMDLATFANAISIEGNPLFRPETLRIFTRRETSIPGTSRALGWDLPSSPSQSGKYLSANSFGHLGYTGTSLWIDPERELSIILLTNRTWPDCESNAIKAIRPAFHDAVVEALKPEDVA